MTRQAQKEAERRTLNALLSALDTAPDRIDVGEQPDFVLAISNRVIGVEVTMYQSGTAISAGLGRRQVESEWEILQRASREFRSERADIKDANVGLMFNGVVPARRDHQGFMAEIAAFIRSHAGETGAQNKEYWSNQFTTPLMRRYLRTLYLRQCEFAEWYSNITAGWVALPDSTLATIVAGKAGKTYKPTDELWLVIQCSHRISETVLQLNGIADYEAAPGLTAAMQSSPFSKVCVIAIGGIFQWDRASGWINVAPDEATFHQGPTLDELKDHLIDPEWLADPQGRAELEAQKVLQEIREGKLP